ncbi:MAG TPA: DUF4835 family protein [Bacteroidales bacterium]|nr:DUF4835 family protein [Bacteroidales bacterium]
MRRLMLYISIFFMASNVQAQELKCNVQVVSQKIQGSNKQVFETLQEAVFEFMNNRVWTNHVYDIEERIECNFMFNITDQLSADEFEATLQVQFRRPVYNTNYYTTMFNYIDKDVKFRYIEFEPLEFDLNSYTSNLTSILGFYAYFILGLDYDSFSFEGGTPYYENAEKVVLNAQNSSNENGWKPADDMAHNNRYWLVNDILDQEYAPVREFYYRYHRQGLDVMDEKVAEGRAEIASAIELLQEVYRERPDPYMHVLRLVFDAKADEFTKIFSEAYPEEKNRVYEILTEIDQTNTSKYKTMLENTNQTGP